MNLLEAVSNSHTGTVSESLSTIVPATPPKDPWHFAGQQLRGMVLQAVTSHNSKRNYAKALDEVFALCAIRLQGVSRPLLMEYRAAMIEKGLSPSTINVRLAAVRKLVNEARRNGILNGEEAAKMTDVPNVRMQGRRMGELAHTRSDEGAAGSSKSFNAQGKTGLLHFGIACRLRSTASRVGKS